MESSDGRVSVTGDGSTGNGHARGEQGTAGGPVGGSLEEVRRLLMGPEIETIERVRARVEEPERVARDVADVLPDAIGLRGSGDRRLAAALAPAMEESIRTSIRRDPRPLAEAIAPLLGPAIRRAIADALARMVQGFNVAMEHGLSRRGLRWRLEAMRTGRPFAEVVLLHTLVYRVEQVFLIHRQTGLLLQHVAANPAEAQDGDMVSGMLTAIREFVKDSFKTAEGEGLDAVRVGELLVWAEQGTEAVLAVVIRGTPPVELRETVRDTLGRIEAGYGEALAKFEGDAAPFEAVRPELEELLRRQAMREASGGGGKGARRVLGVVAALLLLGAIAWGVMYARGWWKWRGMVARLSAEPGLVVVRADGGRVYGLRDGMSRDPAVVAREAGVDPVSVRWRWERYESTDPAFVLRRAREVLAPPRTVALALGEGGVLRAEGRARAGWIAEARRLAPMVAGVRRLDDSRLAADDGVATAPVADLAAVRAALEPPETVGLALRDGVVVASGSAPRAWMRAAAGKAARVRGVSGYDDSKLVDADAAGLEAAKRRLEGRMIRFVPATASLVAGEEAAVDAAAADIAELRARARAIAADVTIGVHGREALVSGDATADDMSRARAALVRDMLVPRGVPEGAIVISSEVVNPNDAGGDPSAARSVGFRVTVTPAVPSQGGGR